MDRDETLESGDWIAKRGSCLLIVIAVALHTILLMNAKPLQSANDRSRWCTVWSLIERGTFQIDEIRQRPGWDSIDIIYDDGHFYSTKPPILSVVVAGVTWCVLKVTGWSLLVQTQAVTCAALLIVNIIPFWISLAVLSRLLERICQSSWTRLLIMATAGFGTLASPLLMTLNNHTVALAAVVVALHALERIINEDIPSISHYALCGLASGWVVANELPAAAFCLAMFVATFRKSPKLALTGFAPTAAVMIGLFLAANIVATGSWKPTYSAYGTSKYEYVIDGVPSYWMEPHGVDRNIDSPAIYFLHCTIGHHGLFSLTPIFLIALTAPFFGRSLRDPFLRMALLIGAAISVLTLAFYMSRTSNYNYGGVSCALRWALWLIPFFILGLIPFLDATFRSRTSRIVTCVLLVGSMISALSPAGNPWQQPWLFHVMEKRGWIDYRDKPPALPRLLWSWFPSIPLLSDEQPEAWVEMQSQQADGTVSVRRMTAKAVRSADVANAIQITVELTPGTNQPRRLHRFLIDRDAFDSEAAPADFTDWDDPQITDEQQDQDLTFIRGLPLKAPYYAGHIHYLKTPVRKDAFRCQRAVSAVDDETEDGRVLRYRCEVSLCNDIPFGVARVEYEITDLATRSLITHEEWIVSDCLPKAPERATIAKAPR